MIYQIIPAIIILIIKPVIRFILLSIVLSDHLCQSTLQAHIYAFKAFLWQRDGSHRATVAEGLNRQRGSRTIAFILAEK